ncbi:MAG: hypothetical protein K1060chlam2_01449 [Chlamydiae bacterium]|nr:hypothetical protein [Chlamydiota bacterium]
MGITMSKPDMSTVKNATYNAALSAAAVGALYLIGRFVTSKFAVVNLTNTLTTVGSAALLGTAAQGLHTSFVTDGKAENKKWYSKIAFLAPTLIGAALLFSCKPLTSRISFLKGPMTSGLLIGTASAAALLGIRAMWTPETP